MSSNARANLLVTIQGKPTIGQSSNPHVKDDNASKSAFMAF